MDILDIPFNRLIGLGRIEQMGNSCLSLTPYAHHLNHVGTVHAAALFSLAEAASGDALVKRISLQLKELTAVLRSSEVKYHRPARGTIRTVTTLNDNELDRFFDRLAVRNQAFLDVRVTLVDESDDAVLSGCFTWFVRRIGS